MLHWIWTFIFAKTQKFTLLTLLAILSFTLPGYSQNVWLGMKFTVGNNPIQVTDLGRVHVVGNSRAHTVKLVVASTGADVASGSVAINMAGGTEGQFAYVALASPVTLAANTAYYLVSEETNGGDYWHDSNTAVTTDAVAVCNGPVSGSGNVFNAEAGNPNFTYVPLDFRYTSASLGLRNPDNPANAVNGLSYAYFQGSWSAVPNFSALTPVKSGDETGFSLAARTRNDDFAFRFSGYVDVPTDGTYTFYTTSDDGSVLSIGGTVVVNNDGLHGQAERSGTIGLKAGKHAITVGYFERSGGEILNVSYAGPGINKQSIPASALYRGTATSTEVATGLRNPDNPANAVSGLSYGYYQGSWSAIPNFNSLVSVKSGDVTSFSLAPRTRNDDFAFSFTGYVDVPTDGTYTFYTTSDDGSVLSIGGTVVVNNDGLHGEQERSGTIGLKAGKHAITVGYFERSGGEILNVSYAGPGLSKQSIPASALYRTSSASTVVTGLRNPENPSDAVSGISYAYYQGAWSNVPNFSSLTSVKTGNGTAFSLAPRTRNDDFAFSFTGYVDVPTDGTYTFYTTSDDGSVLSIGETVVVNNDGLHAEQERSGTIGLKAGKHAITVGFFDRSGQEVLNVSYSGPGVNKQVIPASALYRSSSASRTAIASSSALPSAPLSVFPNPNTDGRPTITWQAKQAQDVTLRIFDKQGTMVSLLTRSVPEGESTFRLPNTLVRGTYYLRATIDGEPQNFTLVVE
ncbi:PA14 domain-containing protein [uncultured Hymenobacter sp.]|uniref:PA14 domain-containing protein n=1 Tax=uncultured Hymenobacter sp. TaxID=170016 RepID=UPI0035CCA426